MAELWQSLNKSIKDRWWAADELGVGAIVSASGSGDDCYEDNRSARYHTDTTRGSREEECIVGRVFIDMDVLLAAFKADIAAIQWPTDDYTPGRHVLSPSIPLPPSTSPPSLPLSSSFPPSTPHSGSSSRLPSYLSSVPSLLSATTPIPSPKSLFTIRAVLALWASPPFTARQPRSHLTFALWAARVVGDAAGRAAFDSYVRLCPETPPTAVTLREMLNASRGEVARAYYGSCLANIRARGTAPAKRRNDDSDYCGESDEGGGSCERGKEEDDNQRIVDRELADLSAMSADFRVWSKRSSGAEAHAITTSSADESTGEDVEDTLAELPANNHFSRSKSPSLSTAAAIDSVTYPHPSLKELYRPSGTSFRLAPSRGRLTCVARRAPLRADDTIALNANLVMTTPPTAAMDCLSFGVQACARRPSFETPPSKVKGVSAIVSTRKAVDGHEQVSSRNEKHMMVDLSPPRRIEAEKWQRAWDAALGRWYYYKYDTAVN